MTKLFYVVNIWQRSLQLKLRQHGQVSTLFHSLQRQSSVITHTKYHFQCFLCGHLRVVEVSGSRCQLLGQSAATSSTVYRCRLLSKAPQRCNPPQSYPGNFTSASTCSCSLVANQHAIATTRYDSDPHTHVSTEYSPTWSIHTVAGRVTRPEISASRWHSCVRAILHCWQPTYTVSDAETPPLVHITMVLTRRQNIWCYTAQHMTRHSESWPNLHYQSDPRPYGASWERIRAVTHPPDRE